MPFEIVRNDIVNMQVDAVVNTAIPTLSSVLALTAEYTRKLEMSCLRLERKLVALSLVTQLSRQDLDWMQNMSFIQWGPFGRTASNRKNRFCPHATVSPWLWQKRISANLSHFL